MKREGFKNTSKSVVVEEDGEIENQGKLKKSYGEWYDSVSGFKLGRFWTVQLI